MKAHDFSMRSINIPVLPLMLLVSIIRKHFIFLQIGIAMSGKDRANRGVRIASLFDSSRFD